MFWGKKRTFGQKPLLEKTAVSLFVRLGPGLLSLWVIFDGPDGPTKLRWPVTIVQNKGTYTSEWKQAQNGHKPGCAPENDP